MHNLGKGITVVTGSAGLIGSATIWGINNRNLSNIWSVDNLESGGAKEENLQPLDFKDHLGVSEFRSLFREDSSKLNEIKTMNDIPKHIIQEISNFFETYKLLEKDKWVKVGDWKNKEETYDLIKRTHENYKK